MNAILIAGAALAGLPVLLHLIMKQEPKRLPFPAFRFLKLKQKTNQRKMRLRHFLLLAFRVLLIALFALTLYQPTLLLTGGGLNLAAEQPVAAVLVVDTSPSTGYAVGETTRLDAARQRAVDLLDTLPDNSLIAVVDPGDPDDAAGEWQPSAGDAREKLDAMTTPRPAARPVTDGIATAYRLLATADQQSDAATPLPRLVVVFSDRTASSWDASRAGDLNKLREAIPDPPPTAGLYVDVGVDEPTNVAITSATVDPPVVPANRPVTLAVTVQAAGADVPNAAVQCRLDNAGTPLSKPLALTAGSPQAVTFTFADLPPGFHQAVVSLETPDAIPADNTRYVTFRVGSTRPVLTIADDSEDARFWQLANQLQGEFDVAVETPAAVEADGFDLARYEAVVLLSVADPTNLWRKLTGYVTRGGELLVIPGGRNQLTPAAYDPASNPGAAGLMPGTLTEVVDVSPDRPTGVGWVTDDRATRHPLLAPFREWQLRGTVDFLKNPRRVWKYWKVTAPPEAVVTTYDWPVDPATRDPAVLERTVGNGKVLLLTTRMDSPWTPDRRWNNYWETAGSSWAVVFPHLLLTYLAGDSADAVFTFPAGEPVTLPLPAADADTPRKLVLEGPGVTGRDAYPEVDEAQTELRLPAGKTRTPGNYVLRTEDGTWKEAFSLNTPADESDLSRTPDEAIAAVFGPDRIIPAAKDLDIREALELKFDQPVDLFPWLLIMVLLLFAVEGLMANRFYRMPRPA